MWIDYALGRGRSVHERRCLLNQDLDQDTARWENKNDSHLIPG